MNLSRKKYQFFIALIDIILITAAVYLSLWIRGLSVPSYKWFYQHFLIFIPIIMSWIICLYTAGLYSMELPYTGFKAIAYISIAAFFCTLLGFAFFYLNLNARLLPKTILLIHSGIVTLLIALWRWVYSRIALKYYAKMEIAFVGINDTVIELLDNMNKFSYMSYNVSFVYTDDDSFSKIDDVPVINNSSLFIEEIKKNKIQIVVTADKENLPSTTQEVLFELLHRHVTFINLADFYEIIMRKIPLDEVNEQWFLTKLHLQSKKIYALFKRFLDILMALILLIISLPFWPFIILIIRIESPGSAFFKQVRVGYLGQIFSVTKFRTMRIKDNEFKPTEYNDYRITKMGNILRKSRIDEIPQFLNVIKSEMSFIGPRPERPELIRELEREIPFYRQRLLVKPGLSGWDQVSGEYHSPSKEDTYKKLQNDLYYIKNMSFFLDISIFFKTLVTIVKRSGV